MSINLIYRTTLALLLIGLTTCKKEQIVPGTEEINVADYNFTKMYFVRGNTLGYSLYLTTSNIDFETDTTGFIDIHTMVGEGTIVSCSLQSSPLFSPGIYKPKSSQLFLNDMEFGQVELYIDYDALTQTSTTNYTFSTEGEIEIQGGGGSYTVILRDIKGNGPDAKKTYILKGSQTGTAKLLF